MTLRERRMVMVVGGALGAYALYQGVMIAFITPRKEARQEVINKQNEVTKLTRDRDKLKSLAKSWKELAKRSYSFDERETQNGFGEDLKRLATQHNIRGAAFQPRQGGRLPKSDVRVMSFLVNGEGRLNDVVAFLQEFYRLPTLTRIRKLRMSPMKQVGGSDEVRIDELVVDTLVLPRFEAVDLVARQLRDATTLPSDPAFKPSSLREALPRGQLLTLLSERNIFKAYEPPPRFAVQVDNQDLKGVEIAARYFWKNQAQEQPAVTVEGKSKRDLSPGQGDAVELTARYADGKTHGPTRLSYAAGKSAVFMVPSHTPPPPPSSFAFQVRNDHGEAVELSMTLTRKGKPLEFPLMKIPARKTVSLPELEGERLALTAAYADGGRATPGTYDVKSQSVGTYVVPAQSKQPVKPTAVPVAKANPDMVVTGLWTYPGSAEMIATNTKTKAREIVAAGSDVDGGRLVTVHPLGGVVKMPGEVYFIYPLGRKFEERVQLDAGSEAEIAAAIERWNTP